MELHEIFLNGAYVTLLASLVVRDLLRLRIMMTIATLCFVGFAFLIGNTSMKLWNLIFVGINIYQAARILSERRPSSLSSSGSNPHDMRSRSQARA